MTEKIKAVIVGSDKQLSEKLASEVHPLVDIIDQFEVHSSYDALKELAPEILFIDLAEDQEAGFNLIRRLTRVLPSSMIFALAPNKQSDQILESFRLGVTDYLVFPDDEGKIASMIRQALGRTEIGCSSGEIYTFFSLKGGQGGTSLAINLADHLQTLTNEKVLLVDLNLYLGDISDGLNTPSTYTPFDLIKDLKRVDEHLLFSSLTTHANGFYLLTPPEEINDISEIHGNDISRMLDALRHYVNYIIVDLPHNFSDINLAAMEAADRLFLVTQQNSSAIKSTLKTLQLFQELEYNEKKIGIIVNRYLKNHELTADDLADIFKQPIFSSISNDFVTLTKAANKGKTINDLLPETRINADIRNMAGRLTGIKHENKSFFSGWKKLFALNESKR